METVSVETISEIGNSTDCQKNPELSDKQKERSGKKKRKSRKRESELKNNDSHTSSQNGNADGAFSSEEKKEGETEKSTSEDQVQLSENRVSTLPAATLHHTDPILSTREDSLLDAYRNSSSRKKSKRRERKKKDDSSCEEIMLDDAEKITNEDLVQLLNTPLSNGIIQEGSHEHTQNSCEKPGAAQLCTGSNLSARKDSQPDATSMTCSQKRKREKKSDRNALKESDVDIHSINAEVAVKYNTITEAEGSKLMSQEENSVASVVINSCLKSKDDTVEQQECTDVKLIETVAQTQSPKAKKRKKRKTKTMEVCDPLGITLTTSTQSGPVECVENNDGNKETDGNTEVKEDVLEVNYDTISEAEGSKSMSKEEKSVASVVISSCLKSKDDTVEQQECTDVKLSETVAQTESPKAKKKKKRKTNTVEVCDPLGNTLPTSMKSGPVECVENNDGNKETDGNTEVKEDVLDNQYSQADTETFVSFSDTPRQFENLQNNMAQGVASSETGGVPRCSCEGQRTRKLVVFDLNGILADIVQGFTGQFVPDGKVSYRSVFRRPFVSSFLDFCFERFHVAIWSSRRIGLDYMVNIVMKNSAKNLLFCFDQSKCTTTKFVTQEKNDKPLFLKDLRTVWYRFGTCISCGKQKYDETNTLLVDDSPVKALCNPPHTGIFPCPYQYTDRQDSALGPEGELRKYLERLADAENVQKFVADNPFGQTAITETHESWEFYTNVIEAHK